MTYSKNITFTDTEGKEQTLTLFNSVRSFVTFNQAFGESIYNYLNKTDDELAGLKVAYAMAKPCLFGKVSFEEFVDQIPIDQLVYISEEVITFLSECFNKGNSYLKNS